MTALERKILNAALYLLRDANFEIRNEYMAAGGDDEAKVNPQLKNKGKLISKIYKFLKKHKVVKAVAEPQQCVHGIRFDDKRTGLHKGCAPEGSI